MTFELSSDQQAARDRARQFADMAQPSAATIDRESLVPPELARQGAALLDGCDAVGIVAVVEEVAVASGTLALAAASGAKPGAATLGLSGLRGASAPDESLRGQLVLSAVALGLGRAALETALVQIREATASARNGEKPQWVVADAATELQAARLLTLSAAQAIDGGGGETEAALARLMASAAARVAIDAALRIAGAEGLLDGTLLERLARDIRTVGLLAGTEEQQRATAAQGLLPQ